MKTVHYKRSHFSTRLPMEYRYSPSHIWLSQGAANPNSWRAGLTKFAVRMLGDMVDHGFETKPGTAVRPGQIVGWIEGFKAISDLYNVVDGAFIGVNPELEKRIELVNKSPYDAGWLYEVSGQPDERTVSVEEYIRILDKTIDLILSQERDTEIS